MSSLSIRFLEFVERNGNRLPHPTFLFIYLCGIVLLLSGLLSFAEVSAIHPISGETLTIKNLLSQEGLHKILANTVTNFTHFAPLGTVLVAVIGIGVAEQSGLLRTVLHLLVTKTPNWALSFTIVFVGILSSLAADTGYVVLIPLAAIIFLNAGRHPLAGIAAAFAGVSGGFSANLLIGPLDELFAGLSTEAAQIISAGYHVSPAGNYWFMLSSVIVIATAGMWVTEKLVIPRLGTFDLNMEEQVSQITNRERIALRWVGVFTMVFITLLMLGLIPNNGILRHPETGSILKSPFMSGIVTLIALYAAIAGIIFGKVSGTFEHKNKIVEAMENTMTTMSTYLVLMFFAAQFINYFAWSEMGSILAINGATFLEALNPHPAILLILFVITTAFINLFIGSATAKWALLAPIFVPMFLLLGITPEATQIAYRIGDSVTNIVTPLMPYFGVVIAFSQKYVKETGVGTIMALMLPYSLIFLLIWTLMLLVWVLFDLPLGPGAAIFIN